MEFPKWVRRGHGLADVLCTNAAEEAAVLKDTEKREAATKEAESDREGEDDVAGVLELPEHKPAQPQNQKHRR